jgi:predicted 2-oxoglutarate/Fe(II)-dependent dioxygenase YbiX
MGFQDRFADARKAAERARAQQQEWSQGRHEAKEQRALAKQEAEAQEKVTVDARVEAEGWWTHPDAFKAFGHGRSLTLTKCDYLGGYPEHPKSHSDNTLDVSADGMLYKRRKLSTPLREMLVGITERPRRSGVG